MPSQRIKDLKVALKDFEQMVKIPEYLRTGRTITNFNQLPREAWGNWLLAAALGFETGRDVTFQEDGNDGIIIARDTGNWFRTEHVSALQVPSPNSKLKNEERVLNAIQGKIDRGIDYAKNTTLVVFIEDGGLWYPNRVGRRLSGKHNFDAIYCIGLIKTDTSGYLYSISHFGYLNSLTWHVFVNDNFEDWSVKRIQ